MCATTNDGVLGMPWDNLLGMSRHQPNAMAAALTDAAPTEAATVGIYGIYDCYIPCDWMGDTDGSTLDGFPVEWVTTTEAATAAPTTAAPTEATAAAPTIAAPTEAAIAAPPTAAPAEVATATPAENGTDDPTGLQRTGRPIPPWKRPKTGVRPSESEAAPPDFP